jgi:hypothetical protein
MLSTRTKIVEAEVDMDPLAVSLATLIDSYVGKRVEIDQPTSLREKDGPVNGLLEGYTFFQSRRDLSDPSIPPILLPMTMSFQVGESLSIGFSLDMLLRIDRERKKLTLTMEDGSKVTLTR